MGKRTIIIEQEQPTFVESAIEVVGLLGGWAAGGMVGMHLHNVLPVATTTLENVGRVFTIGTATLVTEHYTGKAIEEELTEAHEAVLMAKLMAQGALSSNSNKESKPEKAEENKKTTETTKK